MTSYLTKNEASTTYAAIYHDHDIKDIKNLETALTSYLTKNEASTTYAAIYHNHTTSDITDLNTTLNDYLTKANAETTYLSITTAESDYLTKNEASTTYATADHTHTIINNDLSINGELTASNITSGDIELTDPGDGNTRAITFKIGGSDDARILAGSTEHEKGYLEIATADDVTEPIYVRQYKYKDPDHFGTLTREATLLDAEGNTTFPGTLNVQGNTNITGDITALNANINGNFNNFNPNMNTYQRLKIGKDSNNYTIVGYCDTDKYAYLKTQGSSDACFYVYNNKFEFEAGNVYMLNDVYISKDKKLNGYNIPPAQNSSTNLNISIPSLATIKSDSVMEVGKYIDFHDVGDETSDSTVRLSCNKDTTNGNYLNIGGNIIANNIKKDNETRIKALENNNWVNSPVYSDFSTMVSNWSSIPNKSIITIENIKDEESTLEFMTTLVFKREAYRALTLSMSKIEDNYLYTRFMGNGNPPWAAIGPWRKIPVLTSSDVLSLPGNITTTGTLTSGDITLTDPGDKKIRAITFTAGTNDYARVAAGSTAANAGYMEIATADDTNEPIYVRQYSGKYTTVKRTATLLDASGNTTFPEVITAKGITLNGANNTDTSWVHPLTTVKSDLANNAVYSILIGKDINTAGNSGYIGYLNDSTNPRMTIGLHSNNHIATFGKTIEINQSTKSVFGTNLKAALIDLIYPIGCVYTSTVSTDPGTLFGGTWTAIENRFLYCVPTTSTAGATGGSDKILIENLPPHTHTYAVSAERNGYPNGSGDSSSGDLNRQQYWRGNKGLTLNATSGSTGGGKTFLPPYYTVYAWKRTG